MPEEEVKGEPAQHEPKEMKDINKVPGDITFKKEEVKEKEKKEEVKKGIKEMLQRIEDFVAPRYDVEEKESVAVSDEKIQMRVEEDLKKVDEALKKESVDVDELKIQFEQVKKKFEKLKEMEK